MGAPIVHWEINTRNPSKVFDFYKNLFGWEIKPAPGMEYGLVITGSKKGIDGGIGGLQSEAPAYAVVYAEVADPQSALDKAVSLGATVVTPVTEIPNMVTFAQFKDPDGNIFGIVKTADRPSVVRRKKSTRKKAGRAKAKRRAKR